MRKRYSIDLAGQLAECEANYARIMQLLPDMATADRRAFGVEMPGSRPSHLHINVTERCKYTTMVEVYQQFPAAEGVSDAVMTAPVFALRIYHDARMAEVVACNSHRRIRPRYDYPNDKMYQRDEKAQLNRFLGEWLSHCLRHGHVLDDPAVAAYSRA